RSELPSGRLHLRRSPTRRTCVLFSLRRFQAADGSSHLIESEGPQRHDAYDEDSGCDGEHHDLDPETHLRALEVVIDAVSQAVDAVQQREAQEERVEDTYGGLRQPRGHVVEVDVGRVGEDVVGEDVSEHQEHQDEAADAHEHPPSQLGVGAVHGTSVLQGAGSRSHQARPKVSGRIFMSTGIPMAVVTPSTPYHSPRWYLMAQGVKSSRMIRKPLSAW